MLDSVVVGAKPRKILEIGTLVGYSAIRMARLLGEGGRITCLEVSEDMARTARSNIETAGLSDTVEVRVGDARDLIPALSGPYDMVFIDANKEQYLTYLKACERLLGAGAVVAADNVKVFRTEMSDYLDYVRTSGRYRSSYREAPSGADAMEVSIRL